ncbi:hypothetical protein ACU6VJ_10835 [Sphaerotilus sulfidivorans]
MSDAQTAQTQQAQLTRLLEAQAEQERAMARHAQEENAVYQQLAEEASQRYAALQAEFESRLNAQAQRTTQSVGNETLAGYSRRAAEAATHLQMDEPPPGSSSVSSPANRAKQKYARDGNLKNR